MALPPSPSAMGQPLSWSVHLRPWGTICAATCRGDFLGIETRRNGLEIVSDGPSRLYMPALMYTQTFIQPTQILTGAQMATQSPQTLKML